LSSNSNCSDREEL